MILIKILEAPCLKVILTSFLEREIETVKVVILQRKVRRIPYKDNIEKEIRRSEVTNMKGKRSEDLQRTSAASNEGTTTEIKSMDFKIK